MNGIRALKVGQAVTVGEVHGIIAGPGSVAGSRYLQADDGRFWEVKAYAAGLGIITTPDTLETRTRALAAVMASPVVAVWWRQAGAHWTRGISVETWHRADCQDTHTAPKGYGDMDWERDVTPRPVRHEDAVRVTISDRIPGGCPCLVGTVPAALGRVA